MSRLSNKWMVALAVALTLSLSSLALAQKMACFNVGVSLSKKQALPGEAPIIAIANINNCGKSASKVNVQFSITDSNNNTTPVGAPIALRLKGGETLPATMDFSAPSAAGDYRVSASVTSTEGTSLANGQEILTVAP